MENKEIKRYSEADLKEFKAAIEKKLEKAQSQLDYLEKQLEETSESKDSQGDWMDDTSNNSDLEMLQTMANRQRIHIINLQNALQRVHNKSYGICVITGELIDKRRLLAVPTTTKSLAAKLAINPPEKKAPKKVIPKKDTKPRIISTVIRKKKPDAVDSPVKSREDWEEEDDDFLDELDFETDVDIPNEDDMIDLDEIADEGEED